MVSFMYVNIREKKVWSRFVVSPNVAQSLMRWYDDA